MDASSERKLQQVSESFLRDLAGMGLGLRDLGLGGNDIGLGLGDLAVGLGLLFLLHPVILERVEGDEEHHGVDRQQRRICARSTATSS